MAREGHRRRARADHAPDPAGHGLRRARGPARDHRALHLDPVPHRLRAVRAVADPGARPRLVARPDDRGDDPAADRRRTAIRSARSRSPRCSRCIAGAIDHPWQRSSRLGFVADLLSKPTQIGYMNGLALTILVGQLPKLFGFSDRRRRLHRRRARFVRGVADGKTVGAALAVGVVCARHDPRPADGRSPGARRPRRGRGCRSLAVSVFAPHGPRRQRGREPAVRLPAADDPRRSASATCRRSPSAPSGSRSSSLAGHDLDRLGLRRPDRRRGRRQPRDDRHRRGKRRRGPVPGLPGQHERIANRRR